MMGYLKDIAKERTRQQKKWGEQNHDPVNWTMIVLEELGESAEAYLEGNFKGFKKEMTEVAASAQACLESLERIYGTPHFYLAGPMLDCTNDEAMDWRETVSSKLNCQAIIPDLVQEDCESGHIVNRDKRSIDKSIGILANCWQYSPGTSMEILYAWERGKIVVSVVPPEATISAWVDYHSSLIYRDLDSAVICINEIVKDL